MAKATLTNVILDFTPKQNDSVQLPDDARWWKVQNWRKLDGMYIIEITANRSRR